ncbi:MAG: group II truncated hemoglobin [Actinobacteria bacterium]|nr:group II truncated hemoglobin [Actinomycetota bacterium]
MKNPWGDEETPYLAIGGESAVRTLVETFYDVIETESPELRAMLPVSTKGSREKLYEYLTGWLGGPPLYVAKRGHPQLRRRHLPFPIGAPQAEEWLRCMGKALDQTGVEGPIRLFLEDKLGPLALHMVNR